MRRRVCCRKTEEFRHALCHKEQGERTQPCDKVPSQTCPPPDKRLEQMLNVRLAIRHLRHNHGCQGRTHSSKDEQKLEIGIGKRRNAV